MFPDVGFSELLVIALVVLLVGKPEDVPDIMRKLGVMVAHLKHYVAGMGQGFTEALDSPRAETEAPKAPQRKAEKPRAPKP